MEAVPIVIRDKNGEAVLLRSAVPSDAEALLEYLKVTSGETRNLIREREEVTLTVEQEENFIESYRLSPHRLMLTAFRNGKVLGNCSLVPIGSHRRYAHRCGVAIALYREYWGLGIGRKMLETVLDAAKKVGYEQAELEVVSTNERAIALYKKLGFVKYGQIPHNMKYTDGSYADTDWMMKVL